MEMQACHYSNESGRKTRVPISTHSRLTLKQGGAFLFQARANPPDVLAGVIGCAHAVHVNQHNEDEVKSQTPHGGPVGQTPQPQTASLPKQRQSTQLT